VNLDRDRLYTNAVIARTRATGPGRHVHAAKAAVLAGLALALVACGKQADPSAAPVPAVATTAASSPSLLPAGNEDQALTLADCDRLSDPKADDDSAAGRATAVSRGQALRAACKKKIAARANPDGDPARAREIRGQQQAGQAHREISEEEWKRQVKEGAKAPLKTYKY
jgi:hypothetical protein